MEIPVWIVWDSEVESYDITFEPRLVVSETPEKAKVLYVHTVYKHLIEKENSDEEKVKLTEQLSLMVVAKEFDPSNAIVDTVEIIK